MAAKLHVSSGCAVAVVGPGSVSLESLYLAVVAMLKLLECLKIECFAQNSYIYYGFFTKKAQVLRKRKKYVLFIVKTCQWEKRPKGWICRFHSRNFRKNHEAITEKRN